MTWGFLWLMLALKIPIAALIYLVWWAIKQEPEDETSSDDDGGIKRHRPHPRQPFLARCDQLVMNSQSSPILGCWLQ